MGREIRRIAVDFDWPLGETWTGFLLPEALKGAPCPDCDRGQTYSGWWLQCFCQRIEMLCADVAYDQPNGRPLHPWLANDPYPPIGSRHIFDPGIGVRRPSPDILNLVEGLTGSPYSGFGHSHRLFAAIAKAAGLEDWGSCATCNVEGAVETYAGQFAERDAWQPTEPPAGDGWVWETVGEGSPISPVFADRVDLVEWLMSPAYTWGISTPLTREQAERFVDVAWAPSMVVSATTGVVPGEQAL